MHFAEAKITKKAEPEMDDIFKCKVLHDTKILRDIFIAQNLKREPPINPKC